MRLSLIFRKKANIFNSFFAKQCTLLSHNSVLRSEFTYMTEECIQSITFSESVVIKIINDLDVNKAHGDDNISVRTIQLCTNSVAHRFTLIFRNSMVRLLPSGKEQILFQSIRRMIMKQYQTIDQYLFWLYAVKCLKSKFSMNFSIFLRTKI